MKIINVDLDGVVYPWHEIMALWTWELTGDTMEVAWQWDFGNELPYPAPNKWDFHTQWGITYDQLHSIARLGVERGVVWHQGKPIQDAVTTLWSLDEAGYYIRLVTQRLLHKNSHNQVQAATAKWLDDWNIPYHEIVYMGKHSSKSDFYADFALDDNPSNVEVMRDFGIEAYVFERPWNLRSSGDWPSVASWGEFEYVIENGGEQLSLGAREESQGESLSEGSSGSQVGG